MKMMTIKRAVEQVMNLNIVCTLLNKNVNVHCSKCLLDPFMCENPLQNKQKIDDSDMF